MKNDKSIAAAIVITIGCFIVALLVVALFVGFGYFVVQGVAPDLIEKGWGNGGLLAGMDIEMERPTDTTSTEITEPLDTQELEQTTEELTAEISQQDFFKVYFDRDMQHLPSEQDIQGVNQGMTLEQVIQIMGKPHDHYRRADGLWGVVWFTDSGRIVGVDVEMDDSQPLENAATWNCAIVMRIYP